MAMTLIHIELIPDGVTTIFQFRLYPGEPLHEGLVATASEEEMLAEILERIRALPNVRAAGICGEG